MNTKISPEIWKNLKTNNLTSELSKKNVDVKDVQLACHERAQCQMHHYLKLLNTRLHISKSISDKTRQQEENVMHLLSLIR